MPDVALSAVPSPLAALLSGGSPDSSANAATASQGSDPFAALLASAAAITKADAPAGTKTADAAAILLAGAAPVAAAPAAPMPTPIPTPPVATEALPVEPDTASIASKTKAGAKSENHDRDTDSDEKDDDGDPLADAIASGATAVLALAPAIVAPVQPQAQETAPIRTQARIDAPIASKPLKLGPASIGPAHVRQPTTDAQAKAQAPADQAAAMQNQITSDVAQADAQTPQQRQPQPDPATDAQPATVQLSPEAAKMVVTALDPNDTHPTTLVQVDRTEAPAAVEASGIQLPSQPKPESRLQPQQQAAIVQAQHQAAPVQPGQPRRRGEEIAAPRRAGDSRKRVDALPTDAASAGLPQRASDAAQPTISRPVTDVQAKGDMIAEHVLTVARDGAWLDKLAHDIANAGSGNDLHFKLEPPNLGALSVAIRQSDDGASIRLTADNQTTRDMLVDAQPKLVAEARAQGLKVSDTQIDVRQDSNHNQNQSSGQDAQRWAQNQASQNGMSQNGQNRQSSPGHQPFVSNLARKAEADSESPDRDSDARYA
ncbi:MAG: flagellar hook-length control protein FliK [Sphingomonas sp.]|nr:flagellar hook-length control protein FliK [Sphingomonas sp.]